MMATRLIPKEKLRETTLTTPEGKQFVIEYRNQFDLKFKYDLIKTNIAVEKAMASLMGKKS